MRVPDLAQPPGGLGPLSPAAGAVLARMRVPLWGSSPLILVDLPPAAPWVARGCSGRATFMGHLRPPPSPGAVMGRGCIGGAGARGHQAALPRTSTLMRKTMRKKTHMKNRSITLATFFHSLVRRWAARWRRKQPAM